MLLKKNKDYYFKIIDKIEKIRGKNNINWMNILRLSFDKALRGLQLYYLKFIETIKG